jgi:hypothetical protein
MAGTTATTSGLKAVTVSMGRAQEILLFSLKEILNAMDEDELECEGKGLSLKDCKYPRASKVSKNLPPIILWGPPGVGKSSIILAVAEELGVDIVDVRLAQKDPSDMRGIPVPDESRGLVEWYLSTEWPRNPNSRGIIFFDELTSADKTLQAAAYELILDRKLGDVGEGKAGYKVPPGWFICAAGNEKGQKAVSGTMSSALANRFLHLRTKLEAFEWCEWGILNGIHPAVYSFISDRIAVYQTNPGTIEAGEGTPANLRLHNMNVDLEKGWPSPRSWTRVSETLYLFEYYQALYQRDTQAVGVGPAVNYFSDATLDDMIYGLIGKATGYPFLEWYKLLVGTSKQPNTSVISRQKLSESLIKDPQQFQTWLMMFNGTIGSVDKKDYPYFLNTARKLDPIKDASAIDTIKKCGTANFLVSTICSEFVNQTEILTQKGHSFNKSTRKWEFVIEDNLKAEKTKYALENAFWFAACLIQSSKITFVGDYFSDANGLSVYGAQINFGRDLGRRLRMIMERVFLNLENDKIKAARRQRNMEIKVAKENGSPIPSGLTASEIFDIQDQNLDAFENYLNSIKTYKDWMEACKTKLNLTLDVIENPAPKHTRIKNLNDIESLVYSKGGYASKSTVSHSRTNPNENVHGNIGYDRSSIYENDEDISPAFSRHSQEDAYTYSRQNPKHSQTKKRK